MNYLFSYQTQEYRVHISSYMESGRNALTLYLTNPKSKDTGIHVSDNRTDIHAPGLDSPFTHILMDCKKYPKIVEELVKQAILEPATDYFENDSISLHKLNIK